MLLRLKNMFPKFIEIALDEFMLNSLGVLLTQDSNTPVKSRTFNNDDVKGAGFGGVVSTPPPKSTQQPPRPTTDVSEMYCK